MFAYYTSIVTGSIIFHFTKIQNPNLNYSYKHVLAWILTFSANWRELNYLYPHWNLSTDPCAMHMILVYWNIAKYNGARMWFRYSGVILALYVHRCSNKTTIGIITGCLDSGAHYFIPIMLNIILRIITKCLLLFKWS